MFILITVLFMIFSSTAVAGSVNDLAGRKVQIPEEIERITAVGPGALRMVVYLEAADMVVGIEEFERRSQQRPYILAEPELLELPVIGPQFGGDAELIAAEEPDLIIASYLSEAELNNLQNKTSIPVISINDGSPGSMTEGEFKAALNFLGDVLAKKDRAEKLISIFDNYKADLKKRVGDIASNKELYIGGIGNRGAQGITSTEANYPPFKYLGLQNIIKAEDKRNFSISREELLLADPEIIFIDQGGLELVKNDLSGEEFSYLKAYQEDNIYQLLPYNHYTTNFATMLADAYYIAELIYPAEFKDIDAIEKADQIYQEFVGAEVYSQMAEIFGGFRKMEVK